MPAQDNAKLARSMFDLYNKRDFDAAIALVTDGHEGHDFAMGEIIHGRDGLRKDFQRWTTAFPDSVVELRTVHPTDDAVVVEFIGRGTHKGSLETPTGKIAPTNRKVELPFCQVMQIRNGKITASNRYWDSTTLLRQVGLAPELGASATAGTAGTAGAGSRK